MAQVYLIIAFLLAIGVAVFAIQNSTPVQVRLFLWQFQSTLVQIILSSAAIGAVVAFLLGLPRSIRRGLRLREQERYIRELKGRLQAYTKEEARPEPPAIGL